jgi:hypothetical protein
MHSMSISWFVKGMRRRRAWFALPLALALVPASFVARNAPAARADTPSLTPANVAVDFGSDQGPLLHTERYNNFSVAGTYAAQRPADVAYLNSQGLHGSVYRIWLNSPNDPAPGTPANAAWPCTASTGACVLDSRFSTYLNDVGPVADALLGNLRPDGKYGFGGNPFGSISPTAAMPQIERVLLAVKQAQPKLTYIEAWNEPDAPPFPPIPPAQVYPWYKAIYQAVNNVNTALASTPRYVPLQVGGPALAWFDPTYLNTFLDAYAADTNPGKRLHFISYHGYFNLDPPPAGFQFFKANPSLSSGYRAQLDSMLQARGLPTNLPAYITETGIYPGPLCDACDSSDYLRNAAGMASVQYWFANQHDTYPFNWAVRHRNQGLKDESVTRNSTGPYSDSTGLNTLWPDLNPIPTNAFTPYGNMMLTQSMMKTEKVSAVSDSLSNGVGVYAVASKDQTGASLMLWNYQGCPGNPPSPNCPTAAYHATINMSNLPASLGYAIDEKVFRIDPNTSNAFPSTTLTDPPQANLQQVDEKTITSTGSYRDAVDLQPNAIYLITLTPTTVPQQLTYLKAAVQGVGPGTSLSDKISQAQSDWASGATSAACDTLNAFITEVQAQSGKHIPSATAATLITAAERIQTVMAC